MHNVTLFRVTNAFFAAAHAAFLIACAVRLATEETPFYVMELYDGITVDVFIVNVALITHVVGVSGHLSFVICAKSILDHNFTHTNTNPYRWFVQLVGDCAAFMGIMLLHDAGTRVETLVLVFIIIAAVYAFCYLQDQYASGKMDADREPHTFAVPIYVALLVIVIISTTLRMRDVADTTVAIVTTGTLCQTMFTFVIQRLHHKYRVVKEVVVEEDETNEDEEEGGETEPRLDIDHGKATLDDILSDIRRGVRYDVMHYASSFMFHASVTWVILSVKFNEA